MQKDFHFYTTFALARKAGIDTGLAAKIAWADQFTDELVKAELHGIQTSSAIIGGNWHDRQIQLTVLVPFHFLPGGGWPEQPWMVTANSSGANRLIHRAISTADLFGFGIALHTLQDTYSHEGWTGWQEDFNACGNILPNIGHADVGTKPDEVSLVWTDPRKGIKIDNRIRALHCAEGTFTSLRRFWARVQNRQAYSFDLWPEISPLFLETFKIEDNGKRRDELIKLGGENIRYSDIEENFQKQHKGEFVQAAMRQLTAVMRMIEVLP